MTVVVVGGGILGMMHALEARRLDHDVVLVAYPPVTVRPATATASVSCASAAIIRWVPFRWL